MASHGKSANGAQRTTHSYFKISILFNEYKLDYYITIWKTYYPVEALHAVFYSCQEK